MKNNNENAMNTDSRLVEADKQRPGLAAVAVDGSHRPHRRIREPEIRAILVRQIFAARVEHLWHVVLAEPDTTDRNLRIHLEVGEVARVSRARRHGLTSYCCQRNGPLIVGGRLGHDVPCW